MDDIERLQNTNMGGWIIIEHHGDGQNFVGNVLSRPTGWAERDKSLMIHWRRWNCTLEPSEVIRFSPESWKMEIVDANINVVFCKRIAKDPPEDKIVNPCPDVNLYTLVRASVGYF
jgi:primase-polymerase (primpol)-like protein